MRNSGAAIFLLPVLPVLPVFLVFTFVYLCLPPFVFVVENPALPHCLVFDRVLSEFTRSTRFPSFLLPLSSYHSLPTTLPLTTLFLLLCTVSSSYHSLPTTLFLPLSSYHSLPPTTLFLLPLSSSYHSLPPTTPTLYHPLCTSHSHSHSVPPTLYLPLPLPLPLCTTHSVLPPLPLHPRSYPPYPPTYQPTPSPTSLLASSPPLRYFPNWPLPAYTLPRGIRHGRPPSRSPRSPSKSILSTAPPPPHNIVLVHIVNHFVNPAMSLPKRQKRVGSPRTISTTYHPRSQVPPHYPRS
jgi:hypothetical protein